MSDVIGRGVIEVVSDTTKLKAGIEDAKRTVKSLGEAARSTSASANQSIDRYIQRIQLQTASLGASRRETQLMRLTMRGASDAQLKAADSALKLQEAYDRQQQRITALRSGIALMVTAAAGASIALALAAQRIIEQIANYQDLAEKIGDTAVAVASLKEASDVSGASLDSVAAASVRLTTALAKTDEEGSAAAQALKILGVDFQEFKDKSPVEQMDAVAQAMAGIEGNSKKTAIAVALFGKSGADLIPFLNDLAETGRNQVRLTDEQIRGADELTKAQARLRSEFESLAQQQASQLVPVARDVVEIFRDMVKEGADFSILGELLQSVTTVGIGAFQSWSIIMSNFSFVFKGAGREIGAIAAQLVALANLDLQGFNAISQAVKEDAARARKELDAFQSRIMKIGQPQYMDDEVRRLQKRAADANAPSLRNPDISGLDTSADAKAKAMLDARIAQIRAAGESIAQSFDNSEKILEARRTLALVDEGEYYEAKRAFIRLQQQAQETALQKEIQLLQREKLNGKDKIENDKKIAEAQAKLVKVRADGVISLQLLSLQEQGAASRLQQYYRDATDAAQMYLETLRRTQQQELQGMGAGNVARQRNAGRAQIDDKYTQQLRELDKSRRDAEFAGTFGEEARTKYEFELDLIRRFRAKALDEYDEYFKRRREQEADWSIGASEALNNYLDATRNVAAQTENLLTNAFKGAEDALVDFVRTGKLDFSSMIDSFISDLIRMQIQKGVTGPLAEAFSGLFKPNAMGGVYSSPSLSSYSGGIYNSPQFFAFAKGAGVFGEAGPEAIMPLARTPTGELGVRSLGDGGANVEVRIIESPGGGGQVNRRQEGGRDIIEVAVERFRGEMMRDVARGEGLGAVMEQSYGLSRVPGSR